MFCFEYFAVAISGSLVCYSPALFQLNGVRQRDCYLGAKIYSPLLPKAGNFACFFASGHTSHYMGWRRVLNGHSLCFISRTNTVRINGWSYICKCSKWWALQWVGCTARWLAASKMLPCMAKADRQVLSNSVHLSSLCNDYREASTSIAWVNISCPCLSREVPACEQSTHVR